MSAHCNISGRTVASMDVRELLHGLKAEAISKIAGVDLTTARRWLRTGKLPEPARRLLSIVCTGDLGYISAYWKGWRIADKVLVSPERWEFRRGEILSLPFRAAQVREYQRKLRVSLQADWVESRYVEPDETAGPNALERA